MRRICPVAAGLMVAAFAMLSCSGPEPGWEPLWQNQWQWHQRDRHWVHGVDADGTTIHVTHDGLQFRAELFNSGDRPAQVKISGPSPPLTWKLGPGERAPVDILVGTGEHTVHASPGVSLGSPRLGRPLPNPRLLVFVLVDTLRADHVNQELMPQISGEMSGGRKWSQATANCSWTLPSVASLFTARPVLELTSPAGDLIGIPDGMPSWASQLEAAGFMGGAVVANYTIHALNGFANGFASFDVPDGSTPGGHPDAAWVVHEAERWLDAHRGEDAFLYLHLMDPHQPYRSHSDPPRVIPELEPLAMRRRSATADEASALRRSYADEVRHVDKLLAPLIAELPSTAVVVITSDHGEALGEHQTWGHGLNLYQEALLVPLIIRGPDIPAGEVNDPVQLMDLGPTVLELMGADPAGGMVGHSLLDDGSQSPIVSTTFGGGPLRWAWRVGTHKLTLRMAPQPGLGTRAHSAMREGSPLPTGGFYFDLETDPGESAAGPIPPHILDQAGEAFAHTAGRMVPGIQVVVWGTHGAAERSIQIPGQVDVIQAWSAAAMSVRRVGDALLLGCDDAFPLCTVAVRVEPMPDSVRSLNDREAWTTLPTEQWVPLRTLTPPSSMHAGAYLWWNPDRPQVVGGHEETLERLRVLGYIE